MIINIDALRWKYPEADISFDGNYKYENITWLDATNPNPSDAEINTANTEYQNYLLNIKPVEEAKELRKQELIKLKVESLLIMEFAEIDASTTVDDIKKVKVK